MTKKSRSALLSQANVTLPDNNNQEISPADVRNMSKDIVDSFVSNSGETGISGVLRYLSTVVVSDDYDLTTKKFVVDSIAALSIPTISDVAYDATTWNGNLDGATKNALRDKFVSVDTAIGLRFAQGGNSFGVTAVLGTGDAQDLHFATGVGVIPRVAILKTGEVVFGATTKFIDTFLSVKSNETYLTQWQDNSANVLAWVNNVGKIFSAGGVTVSNAGGTFTSQFLAIATGSGAGQYASFTAQNDINNIGQFFVTSSTYSAIPFLGADAAGFYCGGAGGIALMADGTGTFRVSTGGLTERFKIDASGNITTVGNVTLTDVGTGISIKEGTNATMGVSTLSAGTVTVTTTKVTANSRIMITIQSLGTVGTPKSIAVTARSAGSNFTITSEDVTDTSIIAWQIIEPAP